MNALEDDVLRQLGWRLTKTLNRCTHDLANLLFYRTANLRRRELHHPRHAGHDLASAHLGVELIRVWPGRPYGELYFLGCALADSDSVLAPHVELNRGIEVEATAT